MRSCARRSFACVSALAVNWILYSSGASGAMTAAVATAAVATSGAASTRVAAVGQATAGPSPGVADVTASEVAAAKAAQKSDPAAGIAASTCFAGNFRIQFSTAGWGATLATNSST